MNSKKHWPSMFMKSNSSTSPGNQFPEASNSSAMRAPYSEQPGASSHNYALERERSLPKEKSRWNPKPEQIQILEKKFKSGMVTPPREEIKRIRAELEEFGHVEDVNVFYWFQNRKTRAKRKPRLPAAQRSKSRTNSGVPSSTSSTSTSTSTSTSVQSKPITDLPNSPANSMHNNIRDQHQSSDVPISSVAWNHYDLQVVNKEIFHNQLNTMQVMQETTTPVQSKTLTGLSTISANIMHNNIGDQYYSSGDWHHYGLQGVKEEMSNYNLLNTMQPTSTTVQSKSTTDLFKIPTNIMHNNIGDQYYSSGAWHHCDYDLQALNKEMNNYNQLNNLQAMQSASTPVHSKIPANSMHNNIGDQYYSSCDVPVSSFAGHQYDVHAVNEEVSNYNQLGNMDATQALDTTPAAGGQSIFHEGGVQQGSINNSSPLITVIINDVPTAIPSGPIKFNDFFGDDAILFDSSCRSVLVDEFGFTSLEHGATYFVL